MGKDTDCSIERGISEATTFIKQEARELKSIVERMPTVKMEDLSFTDRLETMVRDNFIVASVGAMFGAAVTAGIGVGLVAAAKVIPTLWKYAVHRLNQQRELCKEQQLDSDKETSKSVLIASESEEVRSTLILQTFGETTDAACEAPTVDSCLDKASDSLQEQSLTWRNVRHVTIYLQRRIGGVRQQVENRTDAPITIVYVDQLELEKQIIQIDLLATK